MYKCDQCNREFASNEGLTQHNRDKHGIGRDRKEKIQEQQKAEKKESDIEKSLKAKKLKRAAKYGVALAFIITLVYFLITSLGAGQKLSQGMGAVGSQHVHVDFKVYLDGRPFDFSQPRYQVRAEHVHVEDGDGDVMHVHATGVKIGYFFSTLGMKFNSTCFAAERAYCSNGNRTLKFFVNGVPGEEWEKYVLHGQDRILISYGNETDLTSQLISITNKAQALDTGEIPLK